MIYGIIHTPGTEAHIVADYITSVKRLGRCIDCFNFDLPEVRREFESDPLAFVANLLNDDTYDNIFGFIIRIEHLNLIVKKIPNFFIHLPIFWYSLEANNLVKQAVRNYVSRHTGVWTSEDDSKHKFPEFEYYKIDEELDLICKSTDKIDEFATRYVDKMREINADNVNPLFVFVLADELGIYMNPDAEPNTIYKSLWSVEHEKLLVQYLSYDEDDEDE